MNVPKPEPLRRFLSYCGPVLFTTALGLGASEVILYPRLAAQYGLDWLGFLVVALVLQTIWGMEMARWVVVSGEHATLGAARIISKIGAMLAIVLAMFVGLVIPVWATTAASALWEITKIPQDKFTGIAVWSILTFLVVFALSFFSRVARKWAETVSVVSLLLCWVALAAAFLWSVTTEAIVEVARGLVSFTVPEKVNMWMFGGAIAWVGTGMGLISYTYWMRDAGWGMAKYVGQIPGWFSKTSEYKTEGILPQTDTPENARNLRAWINRSHLTIWLGYFLGSLLTIIVFVTLSHIFLAPRRLYPDGLDVVKYQAEFFVPVFGQAGVTMFLVVAWLLFFNTQIGISEAIVRQNADATTILFGVNIKKAYFIWWGIHVVVSLTLIVLHARYRLGIFDYILHSAMISSIALVVSMCATAVGAVVLYRQLPEGIRKAVRPSPVWVFLLAVGLVYHLYWLISALLFKIGGN